jgi:phosphotransferase system HPr (HPr) family protein
MQEAKVTLVNKNGLHARPASEFVQKACTYRSEIRLFNGEKSANAKSLIAVLALGTTIGVELRIQASGEDEEQAVRELIGLVSSGLGEKEEE